MVARRSLTAITICRGGLFACVVRIRHVREYGASADVRNGGPRIDRYTANFAVRCRDDKIYVRDEKCRQNGNFNKIANCWI